MQHTLLSVEEFVLRRERFAALMPENSIAIISGAKELTRSNDTEFPFCQDKNFYYLTGFNEPDALLVMMKSTSIESILFSKEKNPLEEVWHGKRIGQISAKQDYLFSKCYTIDELDDYLPNFINEKSCYLYCDGQSEHLKQHIEKWLSDIRSKQRAGWCAPSMSIDCANLIEELRLIKSEAELNVMRKANSISGQAHQRAMKYCQAEQFEYQVEAELLHEFAIHGARHPAYASIVAGGNNANTLHYTENNMPLVDGDLLLIDAGAELAGYAADITRTFPVNGRFSDEQKAIYQLVLDTQNSVINAIKPGCTFYQLNELAHTLITEGLWKLGILTGDLKSLVSEFASKRYLIHGIGHWLGLDVHDVGDYHCNDKRQQLRAFEPGMVLTIEPGIYIPIDDQRVNDKWRGIAVRIEDNIIVTENGFENITTNAVKTIDEIEQLMQS